MTAPGNQISKEPDQVKFTLNRAIEELFEIELGSLTVKNRHLAVVYGKHLFRYILERLQNDGTIADMEVKRGRIPTKINCEKRSYIQRDKRWKSYRLCIQRGGIKYHRFGYITRQDAINARRQMLSEIESNPFKYTIEEIAVLANTDHASVLHSCGVFRNLMDTDQAYRAKAQLIFDKINNNQIILP